MAPRPPSFRPGSRPKFYDHSCGERRPDCGGLYGDDKSTINDEALARTGQIASWKIEDQAVGVLEPAYLRLHQLSEGNFHIDTAGTFSNRHACNCRPRVARSETRRILGDSGWRGEAGQNKNESCRRIDKHGCNSTFRCAVPDTPGS